MPLKLSRILWPTDFSELSLNGGRYARALAKAFDAELHVIHVARPIVVADYSVMLPAAVSPPGSEQELLDGSRQGLARLVDEQFAGMSRVRQDAAIGVPWSGICDYAARHEIELIVLATHGRTGLKHVLIGSTAERVVQHAPCPVLTVKSDEQGFVE
jgi:nucleotide-binding universal stress UspA family protein